MLEGRRESGRRWMTGKQEQVSAGQDAQVLIYQISTPGTKKSEKRNPENQQQIFFILLIELPDEPKPVKGQPGGDDVYRFGFFCDDFCQPACGDNFHAASQF